MSLLNGDSHFSLELKVKGTAVTWRGLSYPPCEQSVSKTQQKASKRGSAEIVSSLVSRCSPSFWASYSGQTGLESAKHHTFDKAKVKIEPSVPKSMSPPECDRDLAWA